MNYSTMAFLASDDVKAVKCVFIANGKEYTYKTTMKDLNTGDLVVVQCAGPSNYFEHCVVKVVDVDAEIELDDHITYKWIVSKVDLEGFKNIIEVEKQLIKEIRAIELKNKKSKLREVLGITTKKLNQLSTSFKGE